MHLYAEEPYEWNSSSTGLWGERRVTGASTRNSNKQGRVAVTFAKFEGNVAFTNARFPACR